MPELLLELFSEEIPARMQARGAEELVRAVSAVLAPVLEGTPRAFHGPRRIGLVATLRAAVTTAGKEERGPRVGAPEAALAGFLRKHEAARDALAERGGFWVLDKPGETLAAHDLIARAMPGVIRGFSWPKSMRWDGPFTWVRPLHRILCVLDGAVVPFALEELPGMASGDLTEGHRIMSPGAFSVRGFTEFEADLRARHVILDAGDRMRMIEEGLAAEASAHGVEVVPDRGLLEEVAGLVEWPVPLIGRIDDAFMDLPPEVMRTTMRVNQRYFSVVNPNGTAAPFFGVVANIAASDGGATVIAGNERVLRARLSDARFFWDQDRKHKLEDFLPKLDGVVFHAKLGTQGQRVERLERLARFIAPMVGADPDLAARAAKLAKADLASGMVGEFPELQGVMGRYYALHGGADTRIAEAIGAHYRPLGPSDALPSGPVATAVALTDKLDQLAGFFLAGDKPTGAGDPYALRRAALGVIRLARENNLRIPLVAALAPAVWRVAQSALSGGLTALDDYDGTVKRFGELRDGFLVRDFTELDTLIRQLPYDARLSKATTTNQPEGRRAILFVPGKTPVVCRPTESTPHLPTLDEVTQSVVDFLVDRLRVQLRAEGARHDVVAAAFNEGEDDLLRLLARADALRHLVESHTGNNLLAAYKRAANILRIEDRKDGPHTGAVEESLLTTPEEQVLAAALDTAESTVRAALDAEAFAGATAALAALRDPLDAFFDRVTVNDTDQALRRNRLRLLARLRAAMDAVADFSKIEG